ncbi:MAG: protein-glutamate O-methyltransferase CheR [Treponema sp.]|nr:protein-glutamate O-methyltransferase CheR [Treponema sp.]
MLHSGLKYSKDNLSLASINEKEYSLLSDYIVKKCGIYIPAEKTYIFETRLSKYLVDLDVNSFEELYSYIIKKNDPLFNQKIINSITTNETKWFRDEAPWKVLEETILPYLIGEITSGRKKRVRIWSAAASTGQEIYSTAMCIDNYLSKNSVKGVNFDNFEFFATDISSQVLETAKKGRYDKISIMRGLNEEYKDKYFIRNGSVWTIDPKISNAVKFMHFNLLDSFKEFGLFDVIFCRYVLIYFPEAVKIQIVEKIRDSLCDNGVLFTGNYALYDLFENKFDADYYGNLTYYTKREGVKK